MRSATLLGVVSSLVCASGGFAQSDPVRGVVASASAYVAAYGDAFSMLVAEEAAVQEEVRVETGGGGNLSQRNPGGGFVTRGAVLRREIKSDYLVVRLPDGGMLPFRDVFEVDGRPIRDREDRLTSLFLRPSASSFEQARRVMSESARYNLGNVARNINIPLLGLWFLGDDVVERFRFESKGEDVVADLPVTVLDFAEVERPTLIRTSAGRDLAVEGTLWIATDGVIVKTSMVAADAGVRATVTVTFRADPELELWVPDQMIESYTQGRGPHIRSTSTYRRYRRFQVTTDEKIKRPPGEPSV